MFPGKLLAFLVRHHRKYFLAQSEARTRRTRRMEPRVLQGGGLKSRARLERLSTRHKNQKNLTAETSTDKGEIKYAAHGHTWEEPRAFKKQKAHKTLQGTFSYKTMFPENAVV